MPSTRRTFCSVSCKHRGIDGVFEQYGARKRRTDFSLGEKLGVRDHLIVLTKPRKQPEWMT